MGSSRPFTRSLEYALFGRADLVSFDRYPGSLGITNGTEVVPNSVPVSNGSAVDQTAESRALLLASRQSAQFRAYWRWKSRPRGGRPSPPAEIRDLIREMSIANPIGEHLASTANCSSSASTSGRPPLQSTWRRQRAHPRRAGRPSSSIMPMALPRWTCLSCLRFRFGCYTGL